MTTTARPLAYIAGPMKGKTDWNRPAFEDAAERMRERGWRALIPHEILPREHEGPCPVVYGSGLDGHDSGCYLRACIAAMMMEADLVVLLPGWEGSKGATEEAVAADGVGLRVVHFEALDHTPNLWL